MTLILLFCAFVDGIAAVYCGAAPWWVRVLLVVAGALSLLCAVAQANPRSSRETGGGA